MKHIIFALVLTSFIFSVTSAQDSTYLKFNGYSSEVYCPYSPTLRSPDKMTLSAWVQTYSTGGDWQALMWCGSYYENHYAFKITPDNRIRGLIWIGGPVTIFSETRVKPNTWYHIAFTYDNSIITDNNYKLYINGKLEAQTHIYGSIGEDFNPMIMGVYPGLQNQYFKGAMSNVQFWSRALSLEEIQQKMNMVLDPQQETGLAAYWRFSEGEGNILNDYSGNNNNGTLLNCEWFPSNDFMAKINVDAALWKDTDYNGFEARAVDGSASIGNITSYIWTLNNDTISTAVNPTIEAPSGTSLLKLTVSDGTNKSMDSIFIHVYCSELETSGSIYSAPSELNGSLFISSFDDKVYSFDSTGTSKWTFLTGGDILSTATVVDENNIFVSSTDTRLYSFNHSGIPNWDKAMGGVIVSSPAVSIKEKTIYTGLTSGRIFAVNFKGEVDWSYQAKGSVSSSPVIGNDGVIYFGCEDKNLYAIDRFGDLQWNFNANDIIVSSPAVGSDSSVLIGSNDGFLYKIDLQGELLWKFEISSEIHTSPIIDHLGNIYIGAANGWFYSIAKNGDLNWKYYTGASINSTASLSEDGMAIYFGNDNGSIYALSVSGELKWVLETDAPISAPTLVTINNIVYAGGIYGKVYIIKDIPYEMTTELPLLEWPTYQGNNQRTGERNNPLTTVKETEAVPVSYSIQNYPNPFNPSTKIKYSIISAAKVQIRIFNALGEVIKSFEPEVRSAGNYQVEWNAGLNSSGIYFCTISAVPSNGEQPFHKTVKMLLLK